MERWAAQRRAKTGNDVLKVRLVSLLQPSLLANTHHTRRRFACLLSQAVCLLLLCVQSPPVSSCSSCWHVSVEFACSRRPPL